MEDKLILIDGNSLANRAFYALPPLQNAKGQFCNAIYGFCTILIKIIQEHNPKYLAVAFDVGKPTFRHLLYPEYKGTRHKMPDELASQMPLIQNLLNKMNIKTVFMEGIEADDILGSMSKLYNVPVSIITGDKDCLQLISNNCDVWLTRRGISEIEIFNASTLKEKMSVEPYQIIELKALMGDKSDNIPGAFGIGEKTAISLLDKYQNIENVYNDIENIAPKTREKLIASKENVFLSKTLATIDTNIKIPHTLDELSYDHLFTQDVYNLFKEYNFNSLIKKENLWASDLKESVSITSRNKMLNSIDEIKAVLQTIPQPDTFAFFINENELCFAFNEIQNYSFNLIMTDYFEIAKLFTDYFKNDNIKKIFLEYKPMYKLLKTCGITINDNYFDISLASYLNDNTQKIADNLKLANYYNLNNSTIASNLIFACKDLTNKLNDNNLIDLYTNCEVKLENVLIGMEDYGVKIDKNVLFEQQKQYHFELDELNQKIYEYAGEKFNINSPKQLSDVLFNKLQLQTTNKKLSTDIKVLEEISNQHPIVPLLIRYRKLQKLLSTYLDGLLPHIDSNDIVHTEYNQTLVSTGRLSSNNPNLQNIPTRDELGKNIRKMFITHAPENFLISADYDQMELRLLAHFSGEKTLIDGYKNNLDLHALTASKIFNIPYGNVTPEMRKTAKSINFGVIYGMGDYGLSQAINVSKKDAKLYIDNFFANYPSVKAFMEQTIIDAKANGFVTTLFGRKRKIDEINMNNRMQQKFGERAAMNAPLQGTGSDIIKMAMVKIDEILKEKNLKSKLILQIHDELIIEATPDEVDTIKDIMKNTMENIATLNVPIPVSITIGKSWFEL